MRGYGQRMWTEDVDRGYGEGRRKEGERKEKGRRKEEEEIEKIK